MKAYTEKLKILPAQSGVYIMLDEYDNVLYVGKAKVLKNRVRQYFHNSVKNDKTMALVEKIHDFRYIITPNEYEALILENNLIKQYNPPYNILLKDDKTYPYIRIRTKEKFPRVEICYKMKADGNKYFGPYMLGVSVRDVLEIIHTVFPVRSCNTLGKRECLNYHIGRCLAPCTGRIGEDEYKKVIKNVIDFLSGNDETVKKILTEKMMSCAEKEEFEQAKIYRDTLKSLENLMRKQTIPFKQETDIDVFTFVTNGMYSVVNCFAVRGGKYLGGINFPCRETELSNGLTSFIMQYYENNSINCSEILVSSEIEFKEELSDYLSAKAGRKIQVVVPSGGIRRQLVDMGVTNAKDYLARQLEHQNRYDELTLGGVKQLKEFLGLPILPMRMECYDISHISGTNKVASMVVFKEGAKASNHYRHFRIKTVAGNNDFACMFETLTRRFEEWKAQKDLSFSERPDLIVIDGGKGQLGYVMEAMKKEGLDFTVISLAKRIEEVFVPGKEESILLPRDSLALKLLIRIRDEAHRFAITYHRSLRLKQMTESELTAIEGIGKTKARNLLVHFRKTEKIASASVEELTEVKGIGKADAERIAAYFSGKSQGDN